MNTIGISDYEYLKTLLPKIYSDNLSKQEIIYYVQQEDFEKYKKWKERKFGSFIDICQMSTTEASNYLYIDFKDILVRCNENWYYFDNEKSLWSRKEKPNYRISMLIKKYIDIEKENTKQIKDYEKRKEKLKELRELNKYLTCHSFISSIVTNFTDLLNDNNITNLFDSKREIIAFKNGIFNLNDGSFRTKIYFSDYITETLNYNYEKCTSDEEIEYVYNNIKKICNNSDIITNYVLDIISYSLLGLPHLEQEFYVFQGTSACNGKTTLLEILTEVFPLYCIKLNNDTFINGFTKSHKYICKIPKKRIVFSEELPKEKLNINLLKEFSDGKKLSTEIMFGTSQDIILSCKLFMTTNYSPNFDIDKGIARRYNEIRLSSKFHNDEDYDKLIKENMKRDNDFLCDKNFVYNMTNKYKYALIDILFTRSTNYYKKGLVRPVEIRNNINETLELNDEMLSFLEENFECIKDHREAKVDIIKIFDTKYSKKMTFKDISTEIKRKWSCVEYFKDNRINSKKGIFINLKIINN